MSDEKEKGNLTFRNLNLESRNGGLGVDFVTGPGMGECYKDKLRT